MFHILPYLYPVNIDIQNKSFIMFTLSILPNFTGSKGQFIKALILCLVLDSIIILPFII